MSDLDALHALVQRCATTTLDRERAHLADEISELLYATEADLSVLRPLFDSSDLECARVLVAILEEHSHRSREVAAWLQSLVNHPDESVRYGALLCIMELDPREFPILMRRLLEALADDGSAAAQVAVTQFLAHADLASLGDVASKLDRALRAPMLQLVRGEVSLDDRPPAGPEGLIAVAAAARLPVGEAEARLELLLRETTDGPALAAAEVLLEQLKNR